MGCLAYGIHIYFRKHDEPINMTKTLRTKNATAPAAKP